MSRVLMHLAQHSSNIDQERYYYESCSPKAKCSPVEVFLSNCPRWDFFSSKVSRIHVRILGHPNSATQKMRERERERRAFKVTPFLYSLRIKRIVNLRFMLNKEEHLY